MTALTAIGGRHGRYPIAYLEVPLSGNRIPHLDNGPSGLMSHQKRRLQAKQAVINHVNICRAERAVFHLYQYFIASHDRHGNLPYLHFSRCGIDNPSV